MDRKIRVFISYSRQDKELVNRLEDYLENLDPGGMLQIIDALSRLMNKYKVRNMPE